MNAFSTHNSDASKLLLWKSINACRWAENELCGLLNGSGAIWKVHDDYEEDNAIQITNSVDDPNEEVDELEGDVDLNGFAESIDGESLAESVSKTKKVHLLLDLIE